MSIRVLLVDDNNLFRLGLSALIAAHDDFEVVGDMRGGKEAVQGTLNLNPDVVLMDIMLAGVNGLESVTQIKRRLPKVNIVILTEFRTLRDRFEREEPFHLAVGAKSGGTN